MMIILNFVKKVLKKDADALWEAHSKDYFDNLLPQLRDAWVDDETLSRLGIDDFMKHINYKHDCTNMPKISFPINSKLTKEELVECLVGVNQMSYKCYCVEEMVGVFVKGYIVQHPEIQESFDKYIENKWHFDHEFRYNDDTYLLDILRDLYNKNAMSDESVIEARKKLSKKTKDELLNNAANLLNLIIMANMLIAQAMSCAVHSQLTLANSATKIEALQAKCDAYKTKA